MTKHISILGAGIMGLSCAYSLQRQNENHRISLYDPAALAAKNASWMAGGMLAPYSEIEHMDMAWVEAGLHGIEIWKAAPLDCGFHQNGSLFIAHPEDRHALERFAAFLPDNMASAQISPSMVDPALPDKFKSGLFLPPEAHIEPRRAIAALIDAVKNDITIHQQAATPEQLDADIIIDCRGMSGDETLRGVKGEIAIVRNPEFSLSRPLRLMHPRYPLYIIPRPDHVFMIGATIIESDEGNHVSLRSSMELMSALYSLHPSFGEAEILELSTGIRPSYPDNLPRIKVQKNVISANGLFRHGFLLGPVMAEAITDYIHGQTNTYWNLLTHGQATNKTDNQRAA